MKIDYLKVNGFGKLENKEIEFGKKINVIYGENEAGKTTLKVEDSRPEGKPYFEIHFGKHTTEGMVNTGMDYFVEFHA